MVGQVEVGGVIRTVDLEATMDADLDLLRISVYCTADELLPTRPGNHRRKLTDAEIVTLCVAQVLMGKPSDRRFLKAARRQLGHLFFVLPSQDALHKRRARLTEAIESLVKTYRTLQSGLIYETRPQNPYAAGIQDRLANAIEELREVMAEEAGMQTLRDTDVLATLVFMQRLEIQHNNGRRRGRAFFDFLRTYFPEPAPSVEI